MDSKNITNLLLKLNRLTVDGELKWECSGSPSSISVYRDVYIPRYFQAKYKEQIIAVYEERYQDYAPELDQVYHSGRICLAFLNHNNQLIWEYSENSRALGDLFDSIIEKSAGIDDIINNLLS